MWSEADMLLVSSYASFGKKHQESTFIEYRCLKDWITEESKCQSYYIWAGSYLAKPDRHWQKASILGGN